MEKINIKDFSNKFKNSFNFLIKKYNYRIAELEEGSSKKDNSIIHKLIYTNIYIKRIIEFVLIAEDYKTHMFSRIGETYVKRLSENNSVPIYHDFENCYTIGELEEFLTIKFKYPDFHKEPETYIERIQHLFNQLEKIISSNYWPSIEEIGILQNKRVGFVSVGKTSVPYIDKIKFELAELQNNGYKIIFDEAQIPAYEQSFMSPSISYYNQEKNISIDITFQTRDQEFYVSSNKNKNYFYGRATIDEFIKLRNKILNE